MSGTAEPGWYDDGSGRHRWWDGTRWTGDHVDLNERTLRVESDGVRSAPTAPPGWFDDGRGRLRWWDGRQWTAQVRHTDDAREYGGITVDGRWIHFGAHSVPVKDVVALVASVGEISRRRSLSDAVTQRTLVGTTGPMKAGQFGRLDRRLAYLAVEAAPHLWLTPVYANDVPRAQQFAAWINTSAQHYRYR